MIKRNGNGQFVKGSNYRKAQPYWDRDYLYDLYINKELSSADIAIKFNVTDGNILYWLRKHGIHRRTIAEARDVKYWGSPGDTNGMSGRFESLNPNYKGGITPLRQAVYANAEWKALSSSVLKRANGHCERCGKPCELLHIHHIIPLQDGGEILCNEDELKVICPKCHGYIHSKNNISRELISSATLSL